MPAPVISLTSSILSNPQWVHWWHWFAASGSPTSWQIVSGGVPPGMTFDAARGYLSGAAILPGEGVMVLTATNGDGTSEPVEFTFGIEAGAPRADTAIELNWDVVTGRVSRRTFSTTTTAEDVNTPLFAVKEGDDVRLRIFLVKGTTTAVVEVIDLRLVLKQFDPEDVVLASTGYLTDGIGAEATHLLHAKVLSTAVASALAESEADDGTSFIALAEFERTEQNPIWNIAATLVTNLTGTHNDLGFEAVPLGVDGNDVSIRYLDPAANSATLSVSVSGTDITVNLATNGGGAITTTAEQIAGAIIASGAASALVSVFMPPTATAIDGVVTAMPATSLSGGRPGIGGELAVVSSRTFRILVERDLAENE